MIFFWKIHRMPSPRHNLLEAFAVTGFVPDLEGTLLVGEIFRGCRPRHSFQNLHGRGKGNGLSGGISRTPLRWPVVVVRVYIFDAPPRVDGKGTVHRIDIALLNELAGGVGFPDVDRAALEPAVDAHLQRDRGPSVQTIVLQSPVAGSFRVT